MEYIEKNKRNNRYYLNKTNDLGKILEIVQEIIEGVKYLQSMGVIHRDIKPANILKGKNGWKIADFGFAIKSNN